MKRLFDLILTTFGTILIGPLLMYIAYKIYKEDPGPIIFSHTRIGKDGKEFSCHKFRTMVIN
ncbi:MAG: sugar transferase, partial [Phascolarctobacterium sp.]|nr:sugar transferase [Phascolarctobacterium sp.]